MEVYNEWDETLAKYGFSRKKKFGKENNFSVHKPLHDPRGGEGF